MSYRRDREWDGIGMGPYKPFGILIEVWGEGWTSPESPTSRVIAEIGKAKPSKQQARLAAGFDGDVVTGYEARRINCILTCFRNSYTCSNSHSWS